MLRRPTNSNATAGLRLQLVNAIQKENNTGKSVKVKNPIKFGRRNPSAATRGRLRLCIVWLSPLEHN